MSADRPGGSHGPDDRLDDNGQDDRLDDNGHGDPLDDGLDHRSDAALGGATVQAPTLRVVRGAPTSEEVAALTVVLAAATSGGGPPPTSDRTMDGWAARWRNRMEPRPRGVTWGRN